MSRTELVICGFGGQGVIFAGVLIGHACVQAGLEVAQSAAYGSEARGSACHAGVVISTENISYPKVHNPDILLAMSQAGYDKFVRNVKDTGKVFYDSDLVVPVASENVEQIPVKATAIATDLGKKAVANVALVATTVGKTQFIDSNALRKAVEENSPRAFREMNISAMEMGLK